MCLRLLRVTAPARESYSAPNLLCFVACVLLPVCTFDATALAQEKAQSFSYVDLVNRLTDLEHLAVIAPSGERGAQASSYDRASRYEAEQDRYIDWGANADGNGVIRHQGNQVVLAEITGPGCIWRTWSAAPGKGHVKIFFDGQDSPAVDLPFMAFFDRRSEPFTRNQLVYVTSANGCNNFTPMPFQRSCKIVADPGWGAYYHFTYTTFPKGTVVPTFSRSLSAKDSAALDKADRILGSCGVDPAGERAGQKTETKSVTLEPGAIADVVQLDGPAAITALRVKLALPANAEAQRTLLGQLTIQIRWDDEKAPAVWAPLGDFFASAAGAVAFQSLPAGLLNDGTFYCYWYMPFASRARIAMGNDGPQNVPVELEVTHAPLDQPIESLARFHAKWHRDAFLPQRPDREPDWTLLKTDGRGRYVGVVLHIWNPRGGWWGEGDEKFFVDGEKFPSTFGTGSEDFFGYAWSSPKTFFRPFHDQPVNENNAGHVSVDRWEIAESVPFESSFEGCIEKYFPNSRPTLYAATAFWYLAPGGDDPYQAAPVTDRVGWWVRPPAALREKDAIEGESMQIDGKPEDSAGPQDMSGFRGDHWSGDSQLFWQCHQIGRELTLKLPVDKAGKFHLKARFTKSYDYGIFEVFVDGKQVAGDFDLYSPTVVAAPLADLGIIELASGDHALTLKAIGTNSDSRGLFFGLDFIKLEMVGEK
jgi:hypothetical protein